MTVITTESVAVDRSSHAAPPLPARLANPVTGDEMLVLRSALENGAEGAFRFRVSLPPAATGTPPHLHSGLHETFTVVAGALGMSAGAGGECRVIQPGETIEVPAGTPHRFWNASGTEPAVFESEVTPGADFERFLRGMYGLAADGKTDGHGMPKSPLQFALLLQAADFFPGVPLPLQRAVYRVLTALARLTGADRDLDRYARR